MSQGGVVAMWTWKVENNQLEFQDDQGNICRVIGFTEPPRVEVQGDEAAVHEPNGQWALYDLPTGTLKERRFG